MKIGSADERTMTGMMGFLKAESVLRTENEMQFTRHQKIKKPWGQENICFAVCQRISPVPLLMDHKRVILCIIFNKHRNICFYTHCTLTTTPPMPYNYSDTLTTSCLPPIPTQLVDEYITTYLSLERRTKRKIRELTPI